MPHFSSVLFAVLMFALGATRREEAVIITVAGGGPNDVPALSVSLNRPHSVAVDNAGNLYIAAEGQHRIFRLDASGQLTVVAGNGSIGFSGDQGLATSATLAFPAGVAVDTTGNLFIADKRNHRIRRVDAASGRIATVAGNGSIGFSGDGGPATSASLTFPIGVGVDTAGNLFIADLGNHRIRRVDAASGRIATVAGNGSIGFSGDGGPATSASLRKPTGVAMDSAGNLFVADFGNHRICRVDAATGLINSVAGNGTFGFSGDGGPATSASLRNPTGVVMDSAGNLFVADFGNHRIRRVDAASGRIATVAGNGSIGFSGDGGPATSASLRNPTGVVIDSAGNLFVADFGNHRIRRVDAASGFITTVAGGGSVVGDGGPAASGSLINPIGLGVDATDNLFIADEGNHRIRRVDAASGFITTVAGNGTRGFSGDGGPATSASLRNPTGVAIDTAGNLFIADERNHRIRRVDAASGRIATVAGNGSIGFSGDGGPATSASLRNPTGVAIDTAGDLFIAERFDHRIRRVDAATGLITTVAGNGTRGFSGDGGPATSARLAFPAGLAMDTAGNLFITDQSNQRIRRVDAATGLITTVAGNGSIAFSGDGGPAARASLAFPTGLAMDTAGNLFIADFGNQRIRRVDAATGLITTVAGNGSIGFSGDGGPATSASLRTPTGVAVDTAGNLFIADFGNHRIRRVRTESQAFQFMCVGKRPRSSSRVLVNSLFFWARKALPKAMILARVSG